MSPHDWPCCTVALVGNPNTGKSTVFGALVGGHQRVGNYPGVTVEKKTGRMDLGGHVCEVVDLPGVYSLAPRSRDEMVTVDLLLGRRDDEPPVDLVLCVVDATNLGRNLYLVTQILELGLPTVVALNMIDLAEDQGLEIDLEQLRRRLPVPIVPIQANRRQGIEELKAALQAATPVTTPVRETIFPKAFCDEVLALAPRVREHCALNTGAGRRRHGQRYGRRRGHHGEHGRNACQHGYGHENEPGGPGMGRRRLSSRWLAERLLLDVDGYLEGILVPDAASPLGEALTTARARLEAADCSVPGVETQARYAWIQKTLSGVLSIPVGRRANPTDRIDRVLTHRLWGTIVFILVMVTMFQAVFTWAAPATDAIAGAAAALGDGLRHCLVGTSLSGGALESLLAVGVIGGVGSVLSFLPQILVLFFFIGILEDCGYMARAAYLMDRLMARVGLSGRSFIPLLSSHACAIPGIMATRVISDERDRLTTILVAPLMTCSARLPVYTLLIPAFVPAVALAGGWLDLRGLTLLGLYLLGIGTAVLAALVFR
ncbi:MAG: ferrous iron transporter B, partial [Pirellulales bacterium]|nr:ferrous iron transporter B [Pirellulales bacterium]